MPKQVKISATEVAVNGNTNSQVINTVIMGARRYDATRNDGTILEGIVVLFKDALPILIDGESKTANKKWFAVNTIVDALIMSVNDNIAAKAVDVLNGDYMSLRGITAHISVYTDDDNELHYKLEF